MHLRDRQKLVNLPVCDRSSTDLPLHLEGICRSGPT